MSGGWCPPAGADRNGRLGPSSDPRRSSCRTPARNLRCPFPRKARMHDREGEAAAGLQCSADRADRGRRYRRGRNYKPPRRSLRGGRPGTRAWSHRGERSDAKLLILLGLSGPGDQGSRDIHAHHAGSPARQLTRDAPVAAGHLGDLQASNRAEQVQQGQGGWITDGIEALDVEICNCVVPSLNNATDCRSRVRCGQSRRAVLSPEQAGQAPATLTPSAGTLPIHEAVEGLRRHPVERKVGPTQVGPAQLETHARP